MFVFTKNPRMISRVVLVRVSTDFRRAGVVGRGGHVLVLGRFTQRTMSKDKGAYAEMGPMCPGERVRVQLWGGIY